MGIENFIDRFSGFTEEYKFYNGDVTLRYQPEEHRYYRLEGIDFIPVYGVTTITHIVDKSDALIPWAAKMVAEKLLRNIQTMTLPTGEIAIPQMTFGDFSTLVMDAKSAPRDKVEEAANIGSIAHNWIEQYIKTKLSNTAEPGLLPATSVENERATNCCLAALDWMTKHNVRWLATEKKIYSRTNEYAGTMDGKAIVDSCTDIHCCQHEFKDRLSIIDWKSSNYLYIEYLAQTAAYQYAEREETGEDITDRWIIRLGKDDGAFEPWHIGWADFQADWEAFLNMLNTYKSVNSLKDRMKLKKDWLKEQKKLEKQALKAAEKAAKEEAKAVAKAEKEAVKAAAKAEKEAAKESKKNKLTKEGE